MSTPRSGWWRMIVGGVLVLTACGGVGVTSTPTTPVKRKIGFSVYDLQYGFFREMDRGTHEAATAAGYDYTMFDQKSTEAAMLSGTQDLLNQGISALIISPFKPDAMAPLVDAAKAKGIPVIVNDIGGGGTNYDAIVISDNAKGGMLAADEMDRLIKASGASKEVASITCEPSAVYAGRRNQGFETRIKELGYTVVASLSAHSKQDEAVTVMADILATHPKVAGVFTCNDPMAIGAGDAIKAAGKQSGKDVVVIGFNGDDVALQAIKAGTMNATVQQLPAEMGKMTVDLATRLMNGEKLTYDNAAQREIFVRVDLVTSATAK